MLSTYVAIFDISAKPWSEQDRKQYLSKGLMFAMDGTTLKTADTPEHRGAHFGEQIHASSRISSYPQVRGVTLTAVPNHLIRDAKLGPCGINEVRVSPQA